jgi:hypothetical protein
MNDVERSGHANSIRPQVDGRSEENAQQHVLQNAQTASVEHFCDTVVLLVRSDVAEELTMAEDNSSLLPAGHDQNFSRKLAISQTPELLCCWAEDQSSRPLNFYQGLKY